MKKALFFLKDTRYKSLSQYEEALKYYKGRERQ